jgi:hypothetical protein
VLSEVRREIGDDALSGWCMDNVGATIDIVTGVANVPPADGRKDRQGRACRCEGSRNSGKTHREERSGAAVRRAAEEAERRAKAAERLARRKSNPAPAKAEGHVSQPLARIRELEAENGELRCRLAAAAATRGALAEKKRPLRDRADYMREFMRRKRAAQRQADR